MTPADIVIVILVIGAICAALTYIIRKKIKDKKKGTKTCAGCDHCPYVKKDDSK